MAGDDGRIIERGGRTSSEVDPAHGRCSALFDHAPMGQVSLDRQGLIIEANLRAADLLGVARDALFHRCLADFVQPEDRDVYRQHCNQVLGTGVSHACELRMRRTDGAVFWVRIEASVVQDAGGAPVSCAMISDISDRKRAEEALRESEQRYRALFDNAPIALWEEDYSKVARRLQELAAAGVTDLDAYFDAHPEVVWELIGRVDILGINKAAAHLHGAASPEELRTRLHGLFAPETFYALRDGILAMARGGTIFETETVVQTLDGEKRDVWVRWSRDCGYAGQGSRVYLSLADITRRKSAEEALRLSESRYRTLHESMMDAFVSVHMDGQLQEFNEVYRNMLGYERDELLLLSYFDLTPETWHAFEAGIVENQVLRRGYSDIYEKEYRRKDGTVFPVELRTTLTRDINGEPVFMWAVVRDITERKRTAESLNAKQEELRALASELAQAEEQERRRIAAYLHDEIGQLLAAVRVKFGVWKKKNPSINEPELLADIERTIDQTINDTRLLTYELSPPILFELGLGPALEWIGESVCEEHGIAFTFRDGGQTKSLPEALATALYRIARELLMNVVKHARATHVSVSVVITADRVQVSVEDNGVGIAASQRSGDAVHVPGHFGLLSIRERLSHFGGSLNFASGPGRGTCAVVTAPLGKLTTSNRGELP